jgi:hypothetical protein
MKITATLSMGLVSFCRSHPLRLLFLMPVRSFAFGLSRARTPAENAERDPTRKSIQKIPLRIASDFRIISGENVERRRKGAPRRISKENKRKETLR